MNSTAENVSRRREALYALAHRKLGDEHYQDAAVLLRLMLHLAPADERAWLALGLCHENMGQLRLASELYAAGVLAASPAGRCALACARVLDRQDRGCEATDLYLSAIQAFEVSGEVDLLRLSRSEFEART
jgi:tetratricopeptide (TPR) repeat protein